MTTPMISQETTKGQAICPYCGVGCRLWMESAYGELIRVKGVADAPANLGGICAKGATLPQVIHTPDRLMQPHVRAARGKEFRPDELGRRARLDGRAVPRDHRAARAPTRSPSTAAASSTPRRSTWPSSCSRGRSARTTPTRTAGSAWPRRSPATAPASAPTARRRCYDDIDLSDCLVIWGSNMAEAHPVTFDRIKAHLKANPGVELIVVDPRRTTTAEHATLHVPVAPGGDIALMNAVGRLLLERGAVDRAFVEAHTEGFEEYRDFLLQADWAELVAAAGVPEAPGPRRWPTGSRGRGALLGFYCMGLNQSTVGMWKNNSLINLHLLTGQIGKPGAGPFSLTGQPNAMGGREVGPAGAGAAGLSLRRRRRHRAEVEAYWGRRAGTIAAKPGLTAVEMFRALETGRLKAIWIAATNPAVSLPDLHQVRRALAKAELVVVQDAYHPTETTRLADVLLPRRSGARRKWTSTNSERLVSHQREVVNPPGVALPDWQILARFGRGDGLPGLRVRRRGRRSGTSSSG